MSATAMNLQHWQPAPQARPDARRSRYEDLVRTYSKDLFRYAYWLCHDRDQAQDLVQETLLRAWKSLDALRDGQAVKAWLITILRREHARQFERYQPDFADAEAQEFAAPQRDYDTSTEAFALRRALAGLPAEYREPLLLQVLGGYDYREIGKRLQLSEAAVTTRLYRARQRLQQSLGAH